MANFFAKIPSQTNILSPFIQHMVYMSPEEQLAGSSNQPSCYQGSTLMKMQRGHNFVIIWRKLLHKLRQKTPKGSNSILGNQYTMILHFTHRSYMVVT